MTLRLLYKLLCKRLPVGPSTSFCKKCGREVRDFHVDDDIWNQVQPHIKHGHVLCYNCFCDICGKVGLPRTWDLIPPDDIRKAMRALDRFGTWERGWDGYRGKPFSGEVIERSRECLSTIKLYMQHFPDKFFKWVYVGPASDGSIDVEVASDDTELTFTFYEGEKTTYSIYMNEEFLVEEEICTFVPNAFLKAFQRRRVDEEVSI